MNQRKKTPTPRKKTNQRAKTKANTADMPPIVYAEVAVRADGLMFETGEPIDSSTIDTYYSESHLQAAAVERLKIDGFEVLNVGPTTITIGAPAKTYEKSFGTKLVTEERSVIKKLGEETTADFIECPDTEIPGLIRPEQGPLAELIAGVAINEPVYFFASPFAPSKNYWHLDVPGDVSAGLNADRAHRLGVTGRKVSVFMVDSGWYRHPYFVYRGYRANPVVLGPAAQNPDHDEHGHGTGESANVFAVAPDVDFTMVKINFVNSVGAFNAAAARRPDIISCSWGSSVSHGPLSAGQQALAAAIAHAVRMGITVVFSAGNGHWGFPGQHPDVISAGGTYMHPDGTLEASDYSSGFESNIYRNPIRRVPDVTGLVGQRPRAQYIMLPVEDANQLDTNLAGGAHPNGDETQQNDGWAAFSGTSAAAPQIAGACALMKQVYPRISPATARRILMRTARDVREGHCHPVHNHPAAIGPDLATGHGLTDAYRATMLALLYRLVGRPVVPRAPLLEAPVAAPALQELEVKEPVLDDAYSLLEEALLASVD